MLVFVSAIIIFALSFWKTEDPVFSILTGSLHLAICWFVRRSGRQKNPDTVIPAVIWLTGLSGAGKTTLAHALASRLKQTGTGPVLLDGDEIRTAIRINGFDEASRKQHNLQVGYIASLFEKEGHLVIVSLISPYRDVRDEIRAMCGNFMEVYLSTPLDTCIQRDPKGLYKKAIAGEISEFTGISAPYYPPESPELLLDTSGMEVRDCVDIILKKLNVSYESPKGTRPSKHSFQTPL